MEHRIRLHGLQKGFVKLNTDRYGLSDLANLENMVPSPAQPRVALYQGDRTHS